MIRLFRRFKMRLGDKIAHLGEKLTQYGYEITERGYRISRCPCQDYYDDEPCCNDCKFNSECRCCSNCSSLIPADEWVEVEFIRCGDCG